MSAADMNDETEVSHVVDATLRISKHHHKLAWLAAADAERAEERFDRLAGDRELAESLRVAGYDGREYQAFANEIARYGVAVIRGWIYKREIWGKVRDKGFGALDGEPRPGALAEDADGLADETIVLALGVFRDKVLIPGKWDPAKGASLRTYFIGQCLRQFSNVYRAWRRDVVRNYVPSVGLDVFEDGPTAMRPIDPGVHASITDELRRALGRVTDERARAAFYLNAVHGHTHREIGEKLSMSEKAVESALGRARMQIRKGENSA